MLRCSLFNASAVITITAIVFVFGFPLIIVFIIFFFRYKNRKAKYRLVEQALASGQPLPENLFKEADSTDIRSKGIKNVFVGIGLFIFLWAITEEFGHGCIGLLVMFTGFGQLVIYYTQQDRFPMLKDQTVLRYSDKRIRTNIPTRPRKS